MGRVQKVAASIGGGGALALLVLGLALGGRYGFEGVAIGLAVGVWTVGTLAILVYALTRDREQPRIGVVKTTLTGILKLPVTLVLLYLGATLPPPGLGCFLGGLGLVYSCTVWFLVGAGHN